MRGILHFDKENVTISLSFPCSFFTPYLVYFILNPSDMFSWWAPRIFLIFCPTQGKYPIAQCGGVTPLAFDFGMCLAPCWCSVEPFWHKSWHWMGWWNYAKREALIRATSDKRNCYKKQWTSWCPWRELICLADDIINGYNWQLILLSFFGGNVVPINQ